jgi:hypothetical protein
VAENQWRGSGRPYLTPLQVPRHTAGRLERRLFGDGQLQVVIGLVVTRDGIPVRVWCWLGNTADSALIRQTKTTCGIGPCPASPGSPTSASPPRRTAATCGKATISTSSARSCAPARPKPQRRCHGRATTGRREEPAGQGSTHRRERPGWPGAAAAPGAGAPAAGRAAPRAAGPRAAAAPGSRRRPLSFFSRAEAIAFHRSGCTRCGSNP